ncbi:FecR family protein [Butyricimonas faecalis]|uniref:FecR family protein n=1 Tax=Butyricimonas faecalis TaxID=2093856 RepID=A0A3Q9IMM6_9BACT|nr:FecR family protein [Butyricimonas faecalis]AZS28655.1 FecR family protein [Butyricimonas faecalis]
MKESIEYIDWEIISKSFREELTGEEREKLERWLVASEKHRFFYERARVGGETNPAEGVDRQVLQVRKKELMRKASKMNEKKIYRKPLRFMWYAAAIVLPLVAAIGMWLSMRGEKGEVVVAERVQPGSGRVILELNDGRTYFLDSIRSVETGVEGSFAKAESKSLVYEKQESEELVYNKMIVPRAGEYALTLSDGTRVWLNSETEIRYPVAFGKDRRTVFLSGEAYFEVEKDENKPFYVVLDDVEVKVYGTSFNVNSHYRGRVQTTLVEGKVGIRVNSTGKERILLPNQMAEYDVKKREIEVKDVETYYYTAWRKGEFVFQDETIEEIMDRLCRWYGMEVFYENEHVKEKHFSGIITRFSNVTDILHLIEETATVKFDVKENIITVSDLK